MWTVMRALGVLSLLGVAGACAVVLMAIGAAFQYGINHENWGYFAVMGGGVAFGLLKRRDIFWLVKFGLTGDKERKG